MHFSVVVHTCEGRDLTAQHLHLDILDICRFHVWNTCGQEFLLLVRRHCHERVHTLGSFLGCGDHHPDVQLCCEPSAVENAPLLGACDLLGGACIGHRLTPSQPIVRLPWR